MQTQKKNLACEGTFEVTGPMEVDVNDKDQILVRTEVDDRFYIKVMNRLNGEVSSVFPSECDHTLVCLITHPTEAGFVLEGCLECNVIHNYNIYTRLWSVVYKGYITYRICHGPIGSILAYRPPFKISVIKWDEEHDELRFDKSMYLEGEFDRICYSELFDMLVVIMYKDSEIKAVKLESEAAKLKLSAPIWKLPKMVDGLVIKPDAVTSDKSEQ